MTVINAVFYKLLILLCIFFMYSLTLKYDNMV